MDKWLTMGDQSELRTLTVVGVFVGAFIFLVVQIPTDFNITGYDEYRTIEYASQYWDMDLIKSFADYWNGTIDAGTSYYDFGLLQTMYRQHLDDGDGDFGGYEEFYVSSNYVAGPTNEGALVVRYPLAHMFGLDILPVSAWGYAEFHFPNKTGVDWSGTGPMGTVPDISYLTVSELNAIHFYEDQNYTIFHMKGENLQTQPFWFELHLSYNTTTYGSPGIAWNNDDLQILCGINFDQTVTSYNSWDLIGALLFFNVPQILAGTPTFLGHLLSVILWIPIIYVAFILILRAIGALFGGGA